MAFIVTFTAPDGQGGDVESSLTVSNQRGAEDLPTFLASHDVDSSEMEPQEQADAFIEVLTAYMKRRTRSGRKKVKDLETQIELEAEPEPWE